MASLNQHDLQFILQQIYIAEAHADGAPLSQLIDHPLLPHGLRTVDGTFNNIVPGREHFGSANQPFPRTIDPSYLNDGDGDTFDPDGPGGSPAINNNDYARPGHVADADPRIISNLIADQSSSNAVALLTALKQAGSTNLLEDAAALKEAEEKAATGDADAVQAFSTLIEQHGLTYENGTWVIENVAPDEGLSAPFNSWMTLFGQFFDHGLDLVAKGGNGTVFIPLQRDDPLYVEGSHTNFMVITRTSSSPGADGVFGTADDVRAPNLTTPFVDQNQTYTSHASHQVFLREYALNAEGKPVATGKLLDGENGGLPTWADIKAQALKLGIKLTDADVGNVPLLATDPYGNFIPGTNGFAQVVFPGDPPVLVEGTADGLPTTGAVRTGHAFLDDIAHSAAPVIVNGELRPDADLDTGNPVPTDQRGRNTVYDNELLDRHFITGDGRGNENIGLTAVHHIFHSEHNLQIEDIKATVLATNDPTFIAEWQLEDGSWNGERLFQAARFATEMQYQHLAFEEFARKIQPDVDLFVFNSMTDINPAIVSEFADVVYRFGHSMLRENVELIDANGQHTEVGLIQAFLNPVKYDNLGTHEQAAGAIIRGMTGQIGSEIDEFVTDALRNNLLGLPLDLAAINIARGRDNGVPSLNETRKQFFETTGDTQLKPYESWSDFAYNIKNPASVINFIAAYGTHESVTTATTLADKRAAAEKLVLGGADAPADRVDFLSNTGTWTGKETGLNHVDLWIGGLAEKKMAFGGMLGSTFTFVFEATMENLQNGDRFYYLSRTQGLNFLNELEANSFAKLVMRNTDLGEPGQAHLPGDIFSVPNYILEMNKALQRIEDPTGDDPYLEAISPLVVRKDLDGDGDDDYLQYKGYDHVVLGGTEEDDILIAGGGDDTVWGDGGNDYIEAGYGVDIVHGGKGDDLIFNAGTDIGETDMLHGDEGNDVIHGGSGMALIFGGAGSDFISTGKDGKEAFGGEGNDFILGGEGHDFLLGNEGDDWIEGGNGFDTIAGDNSELFFNSPIKGHDVMFAGQNEQDFDAESGDDIMVQGESVMRNEGMLGFDWAIHKGSSLAANSDMRIRIFSSDQQDVLRNRFDQVEGLSGWNHDDILRGDDRLAAPPPEEEDGETDAEDNINPEMNMAGHELDAEGIARIAGLQELLGGATSFTGGNILLGGGGNDLIEGRGGNDVIDGDAWLNVRISVRSKTDPDVEIRTVDSLKEIQSELFTRQITTDQLRIVREILVAPSDGSVDTAVFSEARENYTISRNTDGSLTVSHTRGSRADGTDILRNIELLRFADLTMETNPGTPGTPVLGSGRLTEGQVLTASIADSPDNGGIPASGLAFQWQAGDGTTFADIPGATDANFTLTQDQVGQQVRFVATYTNGLGVTEEIISPAAGPIGDLIVGDGRGRTHTGTSWDDEIHGMSGDDTLNGMAGNDLLFGGSGDDRLDGGLGADEMTGGTGNDVYIVDNIQDIITELAREGRDEVQTSLSSYTLDANLEQLRFTGSGDFTGMGNELRNTLSGGTGNDTLNGGAGNDLLFGGVGNDVLIGGAGNDYMSGHAGDDTYYVDSRNDVVVELNNAGIDTVITTLSSYTLGSNVENLSYDGTDSFQGTGNALNNVIRGGIGNDVLRGGGGEDTFAFAGSFGHDQIMDFNAIPTGGQDKIDIRDLGINSATFAERVSISDAGADTLITIDTYSIRLIGVGNATNVDMNDFILAG